MDNVNCLKTLGLLFLGQAKNKIKKNSTIHGTTAVSAMRYPVLTSHGSLLFISPKAFKWRRPESWQCEVSSQNQIGY